MKIKKILCHSFLLFSSILKCDIIEDITVLEKEVDGGTQQVTFYYDVHARTLKHDEQLDFFVKAIESGEVFYLENPFADKEQKTLCDEVQQCLGQNVKQKAFEFGLICSLSSFDFKSKAPETVDSLRGVPSVESILTLLLSKNKSLFDDIFISKKDNAKEIRKAILNLFSDESIKTLSENWENAIKKVELLLAEDIENKAWIAEVRAGIVDLISSYKKVGNCLKNNEYDQWQNDLAFKSLYRETVSMFDSMYLSIEKAKENKLNRNGWNDGVDLESLIKILEKKEVYDISFIIGAVHAKRLVKTLKGTGFSSNEELCDVAKKEFSLFPNKPVTVLR
jgi:hypothetical protein